MKILEEFWYGNIEPTDYDTSRNVGTGNRVKGFCSIRGEHGIVGHMSMVCVVVHYGA